MRRTSGAMARPSAPGTATNVFTLTDDIAALIRALGLDRPVLVSHDWGGALAWIFAHRYSHLVTSIPWLPEVFLSTALGRRVLKLSFTIREGRKGTMDVSLVDELVARFQRPADARPPIQCYLEMVSTQIWPAKRARLETVYRTRSRLRPPSSGRRRTEPCPPGSP